ncbi:MAG: winged helix DNA-binding domain-containing protein [Pyrinomonadaceae bacterium]
MHAAKRLVGLHAKRPQSPYLSLVARMPGFSIGQLDNVLYRQRQLLRAHAMRGTVHLLPLTQYHTVLNASAGQLSGMYQRAFANLNNKAAVTKLVVDSIRARGPMTHQAIASSLSIEIDERDLYRIINELCTDGVLVKASVEGSWRSAIYHYELLDRWQPSIPRGAEDQSRARAQLLTWYLSAYAPATLKDISWWSGLSEAEVRSTLALVERPLKLVRFECLGSEALIFEDEFERLAKWEPPRTTQLTLLPSFDPYVIAYIDRGRYIDKANYAKVFKGVAGIIEPVILIDGFIAGVWKYAIKNDRLVSEMFAEPTNAELTDKIKRAELEMIAFLRKADGQTPFVRASEPKEHGARRVK